MRLKTQFKYGLTAVFMLLIMLVASQQVFAYSVKQAFVRIAGTAGETVTTGQLVMQKDSDGEWYKADANDATLRPALGVVGSKTGGNGETIEIIKCGVLTGWSSLGEGLAGYLSETAGAVTQTAPANKQPVATAISTTDYLFNFNNTESGAVSYGIGGGTASAADSLAIPITHTYVAKTTGADAEALTLADGSVGQILVIALVVDGGGAGTLTPTTKSGFATIVFADAGDIATLMFVDSTTGWVIIGTAGVAAPPVTTI